MVGERDGGVILEIVQFVLGDGSLGERRLRFGHALDDARDELRMEVFVRGGGLDEDGLGGARDTQIAQHCVALLELDLQHHLLGGSLGLGEIDQAACARWGELGRCGGFGRVGERRVAQVEGQRDRVVGEAVA